MCTGKRPGRNGEPQLFHVQSSCAQDALSRQAPLNISVVAVLTTRCLLSVKRQSFQMYVLGCFAESSELCKGVNEGECEHTLFYTPVTMADGEWEHTVRRRPPFVLLRSRGAQTKSGNTLFLWLF